MKSVKLIAAATLVSGMAAPAAIAQSYDSYLANVFLTAANFCPRGSSEAAGQIMAISQNQALFSLLGTQYGGDGRTTFALPDLRKAVPIGAGAIFNGPSVTQGEEGKLAETTADDTPSVGTVALKYCIVTEGVFPSRN
ncbi:MAG: phage tail protein [Ponticaulis sp.]|nr:phage tail protein [Ponticaulis sp.]|tara:strand:- start:42404 stop:42817 length:414 start_codon:yes stop_codon:yes gene_type:complete